MPSSEFGMTVQNPKNRKKRGTNYTLRDLQAQLLQTQFRLTECPEYWSVDRDNWLVDFIKAQGNDILSGAFSTLVAKVVGCSWYFEGPLSLALYYRKALLYDIGFGAGWDAEGSKWVQGYLSRDGGGVLERLRASSADRSGPCLGFAHLDESRTIPNGDPEFPLVWRNDNGKLIPLHRSQVCWMVDMPDGRNQYKGVGYCGTSRAVTIAEVLRLYATYKAERLSDLPPTGILFLSNMTRRQWEDLEAVYAARQHNEGNTVWRDLMVAFALDPQFPLNVELLETSRLPEHFTERDQFEMAIIAFALAYRVDAREYMPMSAGPLGTATETEIMHKKAKGKGEGPIFTGIERQLNHPDSTPDDVSFGFDYRDDEEDRTAAEINGLKIENIRKMWEASPNSATQAGPPEEAEVEEEPVRQMPVEDRALGMISTEEARQLLVHEGCVPAEILGQEIPIERMYDVRYSDLAAWRENGPRARVYRDGRCYVLKRFGG